MVPHVSKDETEVPNKTIMNDGKSARINISRLTCIFSTTTKYDSNDTYINHTCWITLHKIRLWLIVF